MIVEDRQLVKSLADLHHTLDEPIVTVGGCFDIVHAGHARLLKSAKNHGIIWILINTDESVARLKPGRPINSLRERMEVMEIFSPVGYITPFSESDPCELMKLIRPQVHIKGRDWEGKSIPEMELIPQYLGKVEYIELREGCSTSKIIERIQHG